VLHVVVTEGLTDEAFLAEHTTGWDEVRAAAAECPPERAAEICGIPAEQVTQVARMFATAKPDDALTLIPVTFLWIIVSETNTLQVAPTAILIPMPELVPSPVKPSITLSSIQTSLAARMLTPLMPVEAPLISSARRRTALRTSAASVMLTLMPFTNEAMIEPYPAPWVPLM
jgi:hypothetical protein